MAKNKSRLVLGRKEGEKILVGPEPYQLEITIQRVDRDRKQVSIMFEAPPDVPIDRWEVAEQKGYISKDQI